MADVSFSMSKNAAAINVLANGSQTVTEGTATPGTGTLELRILGTAAYTRSELDIELERMREAIANSPSFGV